MRASLVVALPAILALAACGHRDSTANEQTVDINAAAAAASSDIANYAAAEAVNSTEPQHLPDTRMVAPVTPAPKPSADENSAALPAPGTPGGLPDDRTPVAEGPFAPDSAQGAANVVQTYYALLEAGKYRRAWALWDNGGADSGMSAAAFAASFARYTAYHANVGAPGRIDSGAGQRYVTVPVQVYGTLRTGGAFHQRGSVTLHRTGDIDGATAAQRSWHIHSVDLKPRP